MFYSIYYINALNVRLLAFTAKSLYNFSSEQLFNANQDYLSALEPFIQTMALTHTMNGSMKTKLNILLFLIKSISHYIYNIFKSIKEGCY